MPSIFFLCYYLTKRGICYGRIKKGIGADRTEEGRDRISTIYNGKVWARVI